MPAAWSEGSGRFDRLVRNVYPLSRQTMNLDVEVFRWINEHRSPMLDGVLGAVSALGEMSAVWLVAFLVMYFFGRREDREAAILLIVAMLMLDGLVGGAMKGLWERPRPYMVLEGVHRWGLAWGNGSFPSGHAYASALAAVIFGTKFRRTLIPLIVFAAATCYSRPYWGMHYPSDVVVGAAMGIVAGVAALRIEAIWKRARESGKPAWWVDPSGWSVFFSVAGWGMMGWGFLGGDTQPRGLLALGFFVGMACWRGRKGAGKWMGFRAMVMGLAGLVVGFVR